MNKNFSIKILHVQHMYLPHKYGDHIVRVGYKLNSGKYFIKDFDEDSYTHLILRTTNGVAMAIEDEIFDQVPF